MEKKGEGRLQSYLHLSPPPPPRSTQTGGGEREEGVFEVRFVPWPELGGGA